MSDATPYLHPLSPPWNDATHDATPTSTHHACPGTTPHHSERRHTTRNDATPPGTTPHHSERRHNRPPPTTPTPLPITHAPERRRPTRLTPEQHGAHPTPIV
ncbi:hypothetical protein BDZ94DRAFT_1268538 [Collybia nuda]|uniref:Uncharacterized protein n=1 Tax=Collybia nuda TaxID=64659 RepID=A0A9P5Y127_9AGAR|nr:hypothetical protein BDZ94DRAFT_1268538 [Collybia nuda]